MMMCLILCVICLLRSGTQHIWMQIIVYNEEPVALYIMHVMTDREREKHANRNLLGNVGGGRWCDRTETLSLCSSLPQCGVPVKYQHYVITVFFFFA